jgi:hypothetical protein
MSPLKSTLLLGITPILLAAVAACGSEITDRNAAGTGGSGTSGSNSNGMGGGTPAGTGGTGNSNGGSSGAANGGSVSSTTGGNTTSSAFTAACAQPKTGKPALRLLNRGELDRTLNDIFPQLKGQWTNAMPSDTLSSFGFDNDAGASVGEQQASALLDTALSVATAATGSALPNLLPCAASGGDKSCATTFLTTYGKRLFRRPLKQAEQDRYLTFFDASLVKSDFKTALKWMIAGLIQSPSAVYRSEIGAAQGGMRKLTPYELATELAYTYGGSTPSAELLTQADGGAIADPAATARNLLMTDGGKQALQHFFEGYLAFTRVSSIQRPNVKGANNALFSDVSADMAQETRSFIQQVVLQGGGGVKDLFTSPTTNVSTKLAQYYGFPAPSADGASVARPAGQGVGILAQGAFLSTHANSDASSPTQRGLFVFQRLLCNDKPHPPNDVPPLPAITPGAKTTRQRYEEQHAAVQPCSTCHALFDPIGFGFEHFDEGGRFRTMEGALTVNSASTMPDPTSGAPIAFAGEEELVTALAALPEVSQCFAGYLATYAFGSGEPCLGSSNVAKLQNGQIGIADAFVGIASEPNFTQRSSQ